jgi:hypothetical protein
MGWKPYGPRGFTRPILKLLAERLERRVGGIYTGVLASGELLKAAELLPPANLEDRQNFAPRLSDFLRVARAEPRALFEVYVVPDEREDERLTAVGAYLPSDRPDLVGYLYKMGAQPDREEVAVVGGAVYHYMWWD